MDQAMDDYRLLFPTLAGNAIFTYLCFRVSIKVTISIEYANIAANDLLSNRVVLLFIQLVHKLALLESTKLHTRYGIVTSSVRYS